MQIFFPTQNAKSRDRSVVAGSHLFWHTLWTLPALFGARTPPKSICTHRHIRLKIFDEKMHFFGPRLVSAPGGVPNVKIVKNLPIKGCLRFCYGGGKLHIFFWLQNAKSRDWGIVWASKLYRRTLWTHPALLGLCLVFFDVKIKTYAQLIKVGEKMHFLETRLAGVPHGVPKVKIVKNLHFFAYFY